MQAIRVMALTLLAATTARGEKMNFDAVTTGTLPASWTSTMTHEGGPPRWEVVADASAPSQPRVFAQTSSDTTRGRFPLAILGQPVARDGELRVRFKPVSGKVDQAAGLVWRYLDENNYYLVRANALENNVVLYKVERGTRTSIAPVGAKPDAYGIEHPVPSQKWSSLSVRFEADHFTVMFDGQKLYEVQDKTFSNAGRVGLWTKADSVTYFDDFEFVPK
jgi:hypothetical protein